MYDDIAEVYHLVYEDWEVAVRRFGRALHVQLTETLGDVPLRILDVSCGIVTQVLGLAAHGHRVVGSDLSPGAIARAQREARSRGLDVDLKVADMRRCDVEHGTGFDAVVCCDNSLPHLDRAGVTHALGAMERCLRPGGLLLLSVRDYLPDEARGAGKSGPMGRGGQATTDTSCSKSETGRETRTTSQCTSCVRRAKAPPRPSSPGAVATTPLK